MRTRSILVDKKRTKNFKPLTLAKLYGIMLDNKKPEDKYFPSLEIQVSNEDIYNIEDDGFNLLPYFIHAKSAEEYAEHPGDQFKHNITLTFNDFQKLYKAIEFAELILETGNYDKRLLGVSDKMIDIYNRIDMLVDTPKDEAVLILGETGTGKELVARALCAKMFGKVTHELFTTVNCAAIPNELIESELFGYERGAFSGANRTKKGIFELAEDGLVFLDEIGEISYSAQTKLLRAIDARKFRRVGGESEIDFHSKIIMATNRAINDPAERAAPNLKERSVFREDLYNRLSYHKILLPPLRDRITDLPLLINHFSRMKSNIKTMSIDPKFFIYYAFHSWPGNIRDLQRIIASFRASEQNYNVKKYSNEYRLVIRDIANPPSKKKNYEMKTLITQMIGKSLEERLPLEHFIKAINESVESIIGKNLSKKYEERIKKIWEFHNRKSVYAIKTSWQYEIDRNVPSSIQKATNQTFKDFQKFKDFWERLEDDEDLFVSFNFCKDTFTADCLIKFNFYIYIHELGKISGCELWPTISNWIKNGRRVDLADRDQSSSQTKPNTNCFTDAINYFKSEVYWPYILKEFEGESVYGIHKITGASHKTIRKARIIYNRR